RTGRSPPPPQAHPRQCPHDRGGARRHDAPPELRCPPLGGSSARVSICPLWLIPCAIESRGPSAPLRLTRADEEMQLNPALALYLRERHRIELTEEPGDPTAASLATFLDGIQAAVREAGWKVEPEMWLSTYTFESLVIYQ